jgi:putative oxidoreductase
MFPPLTQFADFSLLALRLMVGLVLITSGWNHVTKSDERSKSIGMSKGFSIFLGVAEMAGAVGVAFAVFTQLAATGLILVMLGAIEKKIFVWHTGFWGAGTMT